MTGGKLVGVAGAQWVPGLWETGEHLCQECLTRTLEWDNKSQGRSCKPRPTGAACQEQRVNRFPMGRRAWISRKISLTTTKSCPGWKTMTNWAEGRKAWKKRKSC